MTGDDGSTLTLETSDGTTLSWDIASMTGGPQDKYILRDSDGDPRLIVTAWELEKLGHKMSGLLGDQQ